MMKRPSHCRLAWALLTCAGWIFTGPSQALETAPTGAITLHVAGLNADPRGLAGFAVELDGYDATAFATLSGEQLTLQLPSPLDSGSHSLNVIAFYNNGDSEAVQQETLVVTGDSANSWGHAISINNSYRSIGLEKEDFADEEHFSSNGAVVLQGQRQQGRAGLKMEVDSLYDSNPANNTSNNEFDLPRYLLEANYGGDAHAGFVRVGNDTLQGENLLLSDYSRRGVSAGVQGQDQSYSVHTFAFQSDPTTSPDNNLAYPSAQQERSSGAVVAWAPLQNTQALSFSAGYIEGEGSSSGVGFQTINDDATYGGDSWNLALDSRVFDAALLLHAEYAASRFDSDGIGSGDGRELDHSWNALLEYSRASNNRWLFDQWSLGVKAQEVGTKYWSIGNLGLAGDLYSETVYFQGNRGGFGLATEFTQQSNNVDKDPTIADQESRLANLDLYYTPMDINTAAGIWALLGAPSFNGYVHTTRREQALSDALLSGYDLNDFVDEYSVGAMFSKERWSWNLQHSQTWLHDYSAALIQNGYTIYEPASDSMNALTTLMLTLSPSSRVSVSPMLQWNTLEEEETDNQSDTLNFGIDGQFEIIPEKSFFYVNYSLNQNDNRYKDGIGTDARLREQVLNLQATWKALAAKGIAPGIDLYLKGSYGQQQDRIANNGDELYQLLVGFTLYWNKESNQ